MTILIFSNIVGAGSDTTLPHQEPESMQTPVIGLLVQGGPPDIDRTLSLLKRKIPVVVIRGSGLAADLVAFAYQEMQERLLIFIY